MIHTVTINKIIHGGLGLGRLDNGIVVLTPFVLPGEKVSVREIQKKRGYILAEPLDILAPSTNRVAPPCPYYTKCGGCDLQHMNSDTQHTIKQEIVKESLTRAGVSLDDDIFKPIVPSPKLFNYRYRIRLQVSSNNALGFYEAGTNTIVAVDQCLVATDHLNKALAELLHSELIQQIAPHTKEIEILHSPADNFVYCIFHSAANFPLAIEDVTEYASCLNTINAIVIKHGKQREVSSQIQDKPVLRQDFAPSICGTPFTLTWPPGCFSQVNAMQNERLINLTCMLAAAGTGVTILDLFCGMGNFSIPLSLQGAFVTGIERNSVSIAQAQANAKALGLTATKFLDSDVHRWLRKQAKRPQKFDVVIADPPRQGMGKSMALLTELAPLRIIYVSCDPATLARDIAIAESKGYGLRSINPVDMFPQTHHIESVALLEKN